MKKFLLILLILLSGFSFAQAETDERAYIEFVLNLAKARTHGHYPWSAQWLIRNCLISRGYPFAFPAHM